MGVKAIPEDARGKHANFVVDSFDGTLEHVA